MTDEATRKGSTPISTSRVMAPGGVVGVHGGEHQVAGERRLDGDLGGLEVAHLADHDHVRVLAEEGAQAAGEGEVNLRVDLRLADAGELILDRILDGEDVEVGRVDDLLSAA